MTVRFSAGGRRSATFAALRYPNYRRWFTGQVLSLGGSWMQSVAQGWLVYQMTGSSLALGAITAAGTIPTIFLMLPAGAITDRVSNRRLLMVTQVVMMISALLLAALTWLDVLQVWQIAALALVSGIAQSFDAPARLAITPKLVEDRADLQNAIAMNSMMFNLARVAGPAIGGLVLASMGAAWCFLINGLSFLAVLIALAGMKLPDDTGKPRSDRRIIAEIGDGLRYVWQQPVVRTLVALVGVTSLFGLSYAVLLPAYATDVLKLDAKGYGLLNAAVGIGALTGSLSVASLSRWKSKGLQLTVGSLAFPLALLCFAATRSYLLALFCLAGAGMSFVIQNATANTIIQLSAPDALRGRVMSVYTLFFFGSTPVGAMFAGAVAQRWNSTAAIVLGASITLAFALAIVFVVPTVRKAQF
jgi:MFS family permease